MNKMKKFTGMLMLFASLTSKAQVGIGTTTPLARLHVTDSSVLFSVAGDIPTTPGNPPISGPGRRMMWYPDKSAFRVGFTDYQWDKSYIGNYSFACGSYTIAIGDRSTAMGFGTIANGIASTALGNGSTSSGLNSTAMGDLTTSSGANSTAMGIQSMATGYAATAMGNNTKAFGNQSTAMGSLSGASGFASTAMGFGTFASGFASTAMGRGTNATGDTSVAMGFGTIASGNTSTAIGYQTSASALASTAMGYKTTASGSASTAMGSNTTASGFNSVAIGSLVSTNGHEGAFFFGDDDPHMKGVRLSGVSNELAARFNGGYYFITDDVGVDIGVRVQPGGNSWSAISDINRKENFEPVDGNNFLDKIASFKLTSWNYKGQDAKTFRHYGPMAQEFYKAFGKDDYGIIGCDTLINQQDFLGVNLIAIQALEKRTAENKKENEIQDNTISELKKENADFKIKNDDFKKENDSLKARLEKLEKILAVKQ